MRKTAIFVLILLMFSGGIYGWRMGWFDQLMKGREAAQQPAQSGLESKDNLARPTFDIVRAEPSGELVMAGRAEPGWAVTVESDGTAIGTVVASENGEWLLQPTKPLAQGEHALELKAQDPKTARTLFSKQRVALSLTPGAKDRPLVAVTEEGKATKVLQMPFSGANMAGGERTGALNSLTAEDASQRVSFAAVDYEDAGTKSMLHVSGLASPGARIILYIDNEYAGAATAEANGRWSYSGNHLLKGNSAYALRADVVDADTSKVVARAEVKFDRDPRRSLAQMDEQNAAAKPAPTMRSASNDAQIKEPAQTERTAARAEKGAVTLQDADGKVIIVRRGDTLWQIARRMYGNGEKYTQIFENNRGQIRNPNLIYPSQRFAVPK